MKKKIGSVNKTPYGYQPVFKIDGKIVTLGVYKTKELADEARYYFGDINYDILKFKTSKYWLMLRNRKVKHRSKGCVRKYETINGIGWSVVFSFGGKPFYLASYDTKELANEARQCFMFDNYDMEKFKQSKYWLELRRIPKKD